MCRLIHSRNVTGRHINHQSKRKKLSILNCKKPIQTSKWVAVHSQQTSFKEFIVQPAGELVVRACQVLRPFVLKKSWLKPLLPLRQCSEKDFSHSMSQAINHCKECSLWLCLTHLQEEERDSSFF